MSVADTLLLITTSYPRWSDGREAAGSFVADLAQELSKHVSVRVVAPGDKDDIEQVTPRLSVHRYKAPRRRLVNLRMWNPVGGWRILRTLRTGHAAVRRAAADGQVRHILALWALPSGWWARAVARDHRIPYSVWMLGSDVWALGRIPVVRGFLRRVMRDAQQRYADGLQLAEDSRRICGMPVAFLPSTRALETNSPPPPAANPPYRLVFIGRWHRNKGVDLLLDALALLEHADWENIAEVAIFGGGPLHREVNARVQTMIAAGRPVNFGGFIPKAEAERAIVRADWVLIPSRIESIPLIFSDAIKLGRPVVAMPVGDLPNLLHDRGVGILARERSAQAFARALQAALKLSPRGLGAGVRTLARSFELDGVAQRIVEEGQRHA